MKVMANNNIIRTIQAVRRNQDMGLKEAKDLVEWHKPLPFSTALYLDLRAVEATVELEANEHPTADSVEYAVADAERTIQHLADRIQAGRRLLASSKIDQHGTIS